MPCYTEMERAWVAQHARERKPERPELWLSQAAWERARARGVMPDGYPVAMLIKHMKLYYDDQALREDLDSVLMCCNNAAVRAAVRRYARSRLNPIPAVAAHCLQCGVVFDQKRSDARFCGSACRQRAKRRQDAGHVTDKPEFAEVTASHIGLQVLSLQPRG